MQLALEAGLADTLLQLVLDPATGQAARQRPSSAGAEHSAEDAAAPRPAPTPLDFSRPSVCSAVRLQEAAGQLLLQLCKAHHGAVQQVVRLGGLQLLLALLPAPELPPLPEVSVRRPSSVGDTIFASVAPPPKPPSPQQHQQRQAVAAPAEPSLLELWSPCLEASAYATPPAPSQAQQRPQLQALLLSVVACLLSEPGVQEVLWEVHATRRTHVQLLHLLGTSAPPDAAASAQRPSSVTPTPAAAPPAPSAIGKGQAAPKGAKPVSIPNAQGGTHRALHMLPFILHCTSSDCTA